jgi:hypothetical protein
MRLSVLLVVTASALPASADTMTMTSGRVMDGTVIQETADQSDGAA